LRQQASPKRYLTEYYHTQKSVILRVLRTLRSEGNVLEHTTGTAWVCVPLFSLPPSRPVLWAAVMIKYKGPVASMVKHNVVGGTVVHRIVVGPVLGGFSDDTESLGLLTTGNLMVSFVIAFCKCCAEVMERTQVIV